MLRLLHTSDWHLGLELGGHERLDEQTLFLDWLLATCREEEIDALLVCGDVYDTVNPSIPAQRLFADFLARFHAQLPRATLVAIAGNHDSAGRFELPRPFARSLGRLHLVGLPGSDPASLRVPLPGRDGTTAAHVLAIPFLRAADLECRTQEGESPAEAFLRAVAQLYRTVREGIPTQERSLPVVALGHLTLAGSARAGSERILIGGVESVPVRSLSEGCAYVALGHIHRPQTVGSETVRYCGSPYPVDFDERRHPHGAVLVELEADGQARPRFLPAPEFVPFLRFGESPVPWDEVERQVAAFDWSPWAERPRSLHPFVDLCHDGSVPVPDLRRRCEELCRGKPLRLVGSPRALRPSGDLIAETQAPPDLGERDTPHALLARHWRQRHGTDVPSGVRACLEEVLAEIATGTAP